MLGEYIDNHNSGPLSEFYDRWPRWSGARIWPALQAEGHRTCDEVGGITRPFLLIQAPKVQAEVSPGYTHRTGNVSYGRVL